MFKNKIFQKVEEDVADYMRTTKGEVLDGSGNVTDSVFSDSEAMDVWEMIHDNMTPDEIIEVIKKW
jgi:hypothetical protein